MTRRLRDEELLRALGECPPARGQVAALARRLGIAESTVRQRLRKLERLGLVSIALRHRWDRQSDYTQHGVEGALCIRKWLEAKPNAESPQVELEIGR